MQNTPNIHANKTINMLRTLLARIPKHRQDWLLEFLSNTGRKVIGQAAIAVLLFKAIPMAIPRGIHSVLGKVPGIRFMYRAKSTISKQTNQWTSALRKLQKLNLSNLTALGSETGVMIEFAGTVGATYITTRILGSALNKLKRRPKLPTASTEEIHIANTTTIKKSSTVKDKTSKEINIKHNKLPENTHTLLTDFTPENYLDLYNKKDTISQPNKLPTKKPEPTPRVNIGFARGAEMPTIIGNKIPNHNNSTHNGWYNKSSKNIVMGIGGIATIIYLLYWFTRRPNTRKTRFNLELTKENIRAHNEPVSNNGTSDTQSSNGSPMKKIVEVGYLNEDSRSDNTSNSGGEDVMDIDASDEQAATRGHLVIHNN